MPAILIRILTWLMTSIAGQVMFSLGLGMLSFASMNTLLSWILERLTVYFTGTSESMLIFIRLFEIDYGVSCLISAFIIKATIMSAQVSLAKRT